MSDNVTQLPLPPPSDPYGFMIGPFTEYRCLIDGRIIPDLSAYRDGPDNIAIVLNHRLSISVPKDLAQSVAWLVANALAIGRGYSHLGAESKVMPFAPIGHNLEK